MRLLEVGVVVHLVMVPVVFHHGEFRSPFFTSPSLGGALGAILLLLLVRLVMGRNLRGLTLLFSTVLSLVVLLFGMEVVLRAREGHQLRQASEAEAARPVPPPAAEGVAAPKGEPPAATDLPAAEPHGDDAFDPTLNDGIDWTWGHRVVNNEYGFREGEFTVPKPAGLFRIMILGDSLTWGAGLAAERRYSDLLEAGLAEALPDQRVEVLNFGFPGGPTARERDVLLEFQDRVDPDLIVVGFCLNDPQPRAQNYSLERARLEQFYTLVARLRHLGLKRTYAYLIARIDHVLGSSGSIPTWHEALDRTYAAGSREWGDFELALAEIKEVSDQRKLYPPVFLLLIQSMAGDNPSPPFIGEWFDKAGAAADRAGFTVVDPRSRFLAELTMGDLPVNPRDGHPSAACNEIYAEELFEAVLPLVQKGVGR